MKSLFLAVLVLLSCSVAQAQDCGDVSDTKDNFTNQSIRKAKITVGNLFTKWLVEFEQSDEHTYMVWNIAMVGEFNTRMPEGTEMKVKLEDATVHSFLTIEATTPVTQLVSGSGVFTTYRLKFDLTKADLKVLAKSSIEDLRIEVPGINIRNPKIKGRQMQKISDVAYCLWKSF